MVSQVMLCNVITSSTEALILQTRPMPTACSTDFFFVSMTTILALNSAFPDFKLTTLCRSEGCLVKSMPIDRVGYRVR